MNKHRRNILKAIGAALALGITTPSPATLYLAGGALATAAFTDTQAAFGFFGYFDQTSTAGSRRWNSGDSATWTGYITGVTATMRGSTSAGGTGLAPWYVSVDGGAEFAPILNVKADGVISLFSDLPDTAHLVRIRAIQGFSPQNARTFTSGNFIQAWGSAPAIGQGSDMGIIYNVNDPSFPGNSTWLSKPAPGGNVTPSFSIPGLTAGITVMTGIAISSGCLVFKAKCSSVWLYTGMTHIRWSIDGATPSLLALSPGVTASATPSTSTRMWKKVPVACNLTTSHTYFVAPAYNLFTNTPSQTLGVMLGDATATYQSIGALKKGFDLGDSLTAQELADGVTTYGTATGPAPLQLTQQNDSLMNCAQAINGSAISSPACVLSMGTPGTSFADLNTDITAIMAGILYTPDFINIRMGNNNGATGASALIATLVAAYPAAKICLRGVYRGAGNATNVAINAAVTGAANPNVTFLATDMFNNLNIECREEYGQGSTAGGFGPTWPAGLSHPTDSQYGYPGFAAFQQTAYNALCT